MSVGGGLVAGLGLAASFGLACGGPCPGGDPLLPQCPSWPGGAVGTGEDAETGAGGSEVGTETTRRPTGPAGDGSDSGATTGAASESGPPPHELVATSGVSAESGDGGDTHGMADSTGAEGGT
ncbi:MAG: hypothetical protein AAF799_44870 [Myxococcota bacterium]